MVSSPYSVLHLRIDEAPADGRVVDFGAPVERRFRLWHHEGRPAHALTAAGNDQIGFASPNRARRHCNRIESRAAEAVESHSAGAVGQPRKQPGHSREVAIVLARLVGAAEDHIVQLGPVHVRIAVDQRLDRDRREIVRAYRTERSAVAADRGADVIADVGFGHSAPLDFARDERMFVHVD
jgi:hypothetical protein